MDVVISGASGLIGTALSRALDAQGHRPIRLIRPSTAPRDDRSDRPTDTIEWDPETGHIDTESLEGAGAVVNLAGAPIAGRRWNGYYQELLAHSRVASTSLLATTVAGLSTPPLRFVSGSAIGYYGDRGSQILDESASPESDFLGTLCQKWEAAAQPAADAGIPTFVLRTGVVQSTEGGALAKQLLAFRFGLGARMGSGEQFVSWIHIDDMVAGILHLLGLSNGRHDPSAERVIDRSAPTTITPVNMTAPNPVTNRYYTKALAEALNRPAFLMVPQILPRLALGKGMADALLFDSTRAVPRALSESGFSFAFDTLDQAFDDLFG